MTPRSCLAGLALVVVLSGCQRELVTCDITQGTCQRSVYYRMLALRGDGYDPFGGLPPVVVITEAEFRAELEKEAADQAAAGPNPWDTALALLHFAGAPPSTANPDGGAGLDGGDAGSSSVDDQVTHVLAYYRSDTKVVTVISHPNQSGSDQDLQVEGMLTLAHELVHALQDRELDLSAKAMEDLSVDQYFATRKGLVEGDARFYEYLFVNELRAMLGKVPKDPAKMIQDELDAAYEHFDQLGSPLFAAEYLMYPLGAKLLATAYASGGNAAVRHAYAQEPKQTVGFLVGPDGRRPPGGSGVATCALPEATSASSIRLYTGGDHFGALPFYTFLRGWGADHASAFTAAQSWTGDTMQIQTDLDVTTVAVAWRLEFSAPLPSIIAPLLQASGELAVTPGNASLVLTAATSATSLLWQPAPNCP